MAHKTANPSNLESNDQTVNASACPACDRPDWADDMVQCEDCEDWYHFSCAGVSPAVAKRRWVCDDCSPISVSSRSSSASKALELQRLQEEQQIRRRRFLQEKALEKKRLAQEQQQILEEEELEKTFLQEKFNLLEMQEGTERGSVASSKSRRSNHESIMQWMRNDGNNEPTGSTPKDAIKQATNPESVSHNKPSRGVRNLVSSHFAVNDSMLPLQPTTSRNAQSKVDSSVFASAVDQKIVPYLQPIPQPRAPFPQPSPRLQQPLHSAPPAPPVSALGDDASIDVPPLPFEYASSEVEVEQRLRRSGARVKRVAPPEQNVSPTERLGQVPAQPPRYARYCEPRDCARTHNENSSEVAGLGPTSTQIAARRVMSRDLPDFNGNPEDWPIFISQYEITTESCGFSNAENLVRLQRCLKGHARESVRSRLLLPASVPQVIETLRMLYGRPGLLITALLNRVRVAPAPRLERLETVIEFGMELQGLCDHLQASGETAHLNNPSLLQELEDKLPSQMKLQWAMHKQTVLNVTLQTFATYMSHMITAASQVTKLVDSSVDRRSTDQKKGGNRKEKAQLYAHASQSTESPPSAVTNSSTNKEANTRNCAVCDRPDHRIKDCKQFLDLNVENRWRCIHKLKLCRTCLNAHGRNRCRLSTKCGIDGCEFKPHPLLHSTLVNQIKPITAENHSHRDQDSKTLFRVVPVTLSGKSGKIQTYAFLDDGSDLTLMEKSIAQELGESGPKGRLYLNWTNSSTSARTVSELKLPIQSLNIEQKYPHLKGLPISGYEDAVPRILIGLDQLNLSLPLKCREGRKGDPVATKTRLGWCVYGGSTSTKSVGVSCHIMSHPEKELHDVVKYYFAQEDAGAKPALQLESTETTRARQILSDTTVRLPERFETGLLWRFDHFEFPESYSMALRRLESLERKMSREPLLKASVFQQIREYQEKGYAHRATEEELLTADPRRIWYLPIGVVTNPKKPGKVRLMWDAAAKVDGISLNSVLLKGPDLLCPLPSVLFRFRERQIAVSGDIREMFHQLRIRSEDRHAQRFLMRENPSREPDIYLMDVATFGSSCPPCSAQFVKNRNAEDFAQDYPRAVEGITKCHYVDDYLDSFDTFEDAQRVAAEVKMIHTKGGFEIRGWRSNSPEVLMHLGETTDQTTKDLQLDNHGDMERVLGMLWLPTDDVLGFSTQMRKDIAEIIEDGERPTKRQVLRCVMSLFDPLGLLAMYTVHGKILIQSIWRSEKDWDEKIGDEEFRRWMKWISVLNQIDGIRLPRCYIGQTVSSAISSVQLHLFVDASEEAYAAAAYFRFTLVDGTVMCNLIAAKTKVAPLKPLSIPRLELQAAVLGTRLASFIGDNHTISIEKRFFWSDSSTVLAWIRSDARRYRQYVACRVGEILTTTGSSEWKWPLQERPKNVCTEEELRSCFVHGISRGESTIQVTRFSCWSRLLRATAYMMRFISNCRRTREQRNIGLKTLKTFSGNSVKQKHFRMKYLY